jgi:hypothetical protein
MISLKQSLEMAGKNLLHALSPTREYLPYWQMLVDEEKRAKARFTLPAHNIGRWWDAMLRLEETIGFAIPASIEGSMLHNLHRCLDNPLRVSGYIDADPPGWIDSHSQRETLLALAGLVIHRNSQWAAERGSEMVRALDRYIGEDGLWRQDEMRRIAREGGIDISDDRPGRHKYTDIRLTETHGRMIEGLLEFYRATGDDAAIRLASRLAEYHLEHSTRPDGTIPEGEYRHTHSLLGTFRGLLMFGEWSRQGDYIDRVHAVYINTIRRHIKRSGWISHDWGKDNNGETASPGDIAQIALWLARSGHCELLDDAERIVRARILPSQIVEPFDIAPQSDDDSDDFQDLQNRFLGAYGGTPPHPYGESIPITDITAADAHTLCDIYNHIVEQTELGLRVNFHLDYEDDTMSLQVERGDRARLIVQCSRGENLFVRIPGWVDCASVLVTVDGKTIDVHRVGPHVVVPRDVARNEVQITYELPVEDAEEVTDGTTYQFRWRGDDVVGISPNTDYLPFYPTLEDRA